MRRFFLLIGLFFSSLTSNGADNTIMVFGDSLSAGYGVAKEDAWVTLLETRIKQERFPYIVKNASISGDTTSSGLARFDQALARWQPDILILELGGNDGLRGQSLKTMRSNLASMIKKAQASGARVLLVGMRIPPNYGPAYTKGFASTYISLANTYKLPVVPVLIAGFETNKALFQRDGIHPNAAGQRRMLDNVWPVLKPLMHRD